jgi:hypothetical protein
MKGTEVGIRYAVAFGSVWLFVALTLTLVIADVKKERQRDKFQTNLEITLRSENKVRYNEFLLSEKISLMDSIAELKEEISNLTEQLLTEREAANKKLEFQIGIKNAILKELINLRNQDRDEKGVDSGVKKEENGSKIVDRATVRESGEAGSITQETYEYFSKPIGGVNENWLRKLDAEYASLPANIKSKFENKGWTLNVTVEDAGKVYFGGTTGRIRGVTLPLQKRIVVEDREAGITALEHEIGHFIDWIIGGEGKYYSSTKEFSSALAEESFGISKAGIRAVNSNEFFAEIIDGLFKGNRLKYSSEFPKTLELIDKYMVEKFEGTIIGG